MPERLTKQSDEVKIGNQQIGNYKACSKAGLFLTWPVHTLSR
jgi:hypothetical protein